MGIGLAPHLGGPPSGYLAADGSSPSGVIQGRDGNFYGATSNGGYFNQGTVQNHSDGVDGALFLRGRQADGANPTGNLVQGVAISTGQREVAAGNARPEPTGITGHLTCGTLSNTPDGAETVLHFFSGGADGGEPTGGLVQGSDGNFYGTTSYGSGTVFAITPQARRPCSTHFRTTLTMARSLRT